MDSSVYSFYERIHVDLVFSLGSNYVITPQKYPTVISMSYRQHRSFDDFLIAVFEHFSWRTTLWLCDQDQTYTAFSVGTCLSAFNMLGSNRQYTTNFLNFNSKTGFDEKLLLRQVTSLARSKFCNDVTS